MGLLTNPTDFTASTVSVAALNTLKNTIYNWAGTTVNGQGSLSDLNIDPAAGITKTKVADTAVVCGNSFFPGTQTISRSTNFAGENLTSSLGSGLTATSYVGGTLTTNLTSVTSSGAADLIVYSMPANTLTTTLRGLRIKAWGTKASTANAATVLLQFGGTTIASKVLPATAVGVAVWELDAVIFRSDVGAQLFIGQGQHSQGTSASGTDAALVVQSLIHGTAAITESGLIQINGRASVATTTDVIQLGLLVEAI